MFYAEALSKRPQHQHIHVCMCVVKPAQEGDAMLGTVVSMTRYGVFINMLPGLDGFMHISNMSSQLVKSVADLYTVGQQVEVRVSGISVIQACAICS